MFFQLALSCWFLDTWRSLGWGGWDADDLYLVCWGPPVVGQVLLLTGPENVTFVCKRVPRYFVKGFVLKAKKMGERDCVELSQEQPASGKLQKKWFEFLCRNLFYSFYKCCQWANKTCCQSLNRLFYGIF